MPSDTFTQTFDLPDGALDAACKPDQVRFIIP
jgi:hypothetical protein